MNLIRLAKNLIPLGILIMLMGTLGFKLIEGVSVFDAFYMTIITITTVGYGEVFPLSKIGRIFAIFLIVGGTSYILFSVSIVTQIAIEGRLRNLLGRRRLNMEIRKMRNHYILCGYGRMGKVIAKELREKKARLVVIDRDVDDAQQLEEMGVIFIHGNATDEDVLLDAGLKNAKALIISLSTDADAVFCALMARDLCPGIEIVARAIESGSSRRLKAAGVTHVVSPYATVGRSMANSILRPEIYDILDGVFQDEKRTIRMEGSPVSEASELSGVSLRQAPIRQRLGLIIIGVKLKNGEMIFNPSPDYVIQPGDTLISMGEVENLEKLADWLNPR